MFKSEFAYLYFVINVKRLETSNLSYQSCTLCCHLHWDRNPDIGQGICGICLLTRFSNRNKAVACRPTRSTHRQDRAQGKPIRAGNVSVQTEYMTSYLQCIFCWLMSPGIYNSWYPQSNISVLGAVIPVCCTPMFSWPVPQQTSKNISIISLDPILWNWSQMEPPKLW